MIDDNAPHALVVDDDALIRMDAADILCEAGYRPWEACDADDAVKVLEAGEADIQILFTDVQMPGSIDGFGLARTCAERWPHISILVASGQVSPNPGDMPEGAVFINKPFSADVVHDRLQQIVPDGQMPAPLKQREPATSTSSSDPDSRSSPGSEAAEPSPE
jgi:DNA-binding NtrC family response regulator